MTSRSSAQEPERRNFRDVSLRASERERETDNNELCRLRGVHDLWVAVHIP